MAGFFCDSSAIVKRYVNETGSNFVDSLADLKNSNVILLARITRVEIAVAIARRLKRGSIATADAQNALVAFQHDPTNSYYDEPSVRVEECICPSGCPTVELRP